MQKLTNLLLILVLMLPATHAAAQVSQVIDWPQEVSAAEGKITIYQPQPEKLSGNTLTGRAAMSLALAEHKEPIFGALWFTAKIDTDREAGLATIRDLRITRVRWPESKKAGQQRFTRLVEDAIAQTGFVISMERLSASLATARQEQDSLAELKNEAPRIVFSEQLAVLLLFDGRPRFSRVEKSDYDRAVNTPFAVARSKKTGTFFLTSGVQWYQAEDVLGPWTPTKSPPESLVELAPKAENVSPPSEKIPVIVVATEPTELIVTEGKPNWKSLAGGKLLYVDNTETPWLRGLSEQQMYVLLSGRWFRSASQNGPWTFVRADTLPESFKEIPPESDIGGLRASVAGTEEANEAILDVQIPQTAAIKRSEAKLDVQYDGAPKFERIAGTQIDYAVNTATQVLKIEGQFYAVDDGVWFTSATATGAWGVADSIPEDQIRKIPPDCPVYNTKYVYIYDATPQVVYVGYTPGYLWSYPYYGVPVYGTGFYYPPYWGPSYVYYPRPPTWGLHVGYTPWYGWSYGVSWSNGFLSVGVRWGGHSHWYGGGYHRPVVINTGNINIGNSISVGNRTRINNQITKNSKINGNRIGQNNLYNRPEKRNRIAERNATQKGLKQARPATNRENNIFADKEGNLARRSGDRWETRSQGTWKSEPSADTTRDNQHRPAAQDRLRSQPAQRQAAGRDFNDLNRANQARQNGIRRENMQRPMGGRSRGMRR
ncbi:MAG: carbohydrate-binding family V/XII [Desulfatitalea sp.]|nr:hypothetical protein [Desulfatitalea sp.]NNK02070.1 carbohydrate-binding family V/XII [Desulfatitalea sp.]